MPAHQDSPHVLVIDDDPVIRMVVRDALENVGLAVSEAGDAPHGIARAASEQPQLIILDIMLPRVDGLSILSDLQRAAGPDSKVLVFSATGSRNAERAISLGADAYLDKPFELPTLVGWVERLLGRDSKAA